MKLRDVMSSPAVTIAADATVGEASNLLVRNVFTALPVVDDDGSLIGIITEVDVVGHRVPQDPRIHGWLAGVDRPARPDTVATAMTTPVESLTAGADASDAATMMVNQRIRCIPVVDGRQLVGVVTRRDLLRAAISRTDADIRADITRQLGSFPRADRWSVAVQGGVADVEDYDSNPAGRAAAQELICAVPGVVASTIRYVTSDPSDGPLAWSPEVNCPGSPNDQAQR